MEIKSPAEQTSSPCLLMNSQFVSVDLGVNLLKNEKKNNTAKYLKCSDFSPSA